MTDLETLLRETLHARADQAPSEHRVMSRSLSGKTRPTPTRVRRVAGAAATLGVTTVIVVSLSRPGGAPTVIDDSSGAGSQTTRTATPSPAPSEDPTPATSPRPATLALNEYTNAVTEQIVECLQGKGFAVVMNKVSQMSDGAGREQLTFRVPHALQRDRKYRAANATCLNAAEAAVPSPPS